MYSTISLCNIETLIKEARNLHMFVAQHDFQQIPLEGHGFIKGFKRRKWKCMGHTLRKSHDDIIQTSFYWNPKER